MPLRDHFRPPLSHQHSWEGFHGGWPMVIVQQLHRVLPPGFIAEPKVHIGSRIEVDLGTFEQTDAVDWSRSDPGGSVATLPAIDLTMDIETVLDDFDEYEVRIYDVTKDRTLVAAIEIVSPANKDRPDHRHAFLTKCRAMLQQGVAVSIVDVVTTMNFNLYSELMQIIGHPDRTLGDPPSGISVGSCRWVPIRGRSRLQAVASSLTIGQPLPTIPLWLQPELMLPLNLETSYEQACHDLRITA